MFDPHAYSRRLYKKILRVKLQKRTKKRCWGITGALS